MSSACIVQVLAWNKSLDLFEYFRTTFAITCVEHEISLSPPGFHFRILRFLLYHVPEFIFFNLHCYLVSINRITVFHRGQILYVSSVVVAIFT